MTYNVLILIFADFDEAPKQINWISTPMDDLSYVDRIKMLERSYWLNDSAINVALSLMIKQFPQIAGFRNINYFSIRTNLIKDRKQ